MMKSVEVEGVPVYWTGWTIARRARVVVKSSTPAHKGREPPGRPERGRGLDKDRHGWVENLGLPLP